MPNTTLAECGRCFFFHGREFFVHPGCEEHSGNEGDGATITCQACGLDEAAERVDSKPSDGDWEGGDYDRHECIACYGQGYDMLNWDHARLSIRPELAGLYTTHIEPRRLAGIVWC